MVKDTEKRKSSKSTRRNTNKSIKGKERRSNFRRFYDEAAYKKLLKAYEELTVEHEKTIISNSEYALYYITLITFMALSVAWIVFSFTMGIQ